MNDGDWFGDEPELPGHVAAQHESPLAALAYYAPPIEGEYTTEPWTPPDTNAGDGGQTLLFTVANPSGSIHVTAALSGKVLRVELASEVVKMTESELAEEITVVARLAQRRAKAAQHTLIVEAMAALGRDRVATRGFLEYELGIPSPETSRRELAHLYADRFQGDRS